MKAQTLNIRGYYYDAEKKKYFKIQANSPASAAYSSQDVKKRKARDAEEYERAAKEARQQNHIRRTPVLRAPLAGRLLSRELGQSSSNSLDAADIYSSNLAYNDKLEIISLDKTEFARDKVSYIMRHEFGHAGLCTSLCTNESIRRIATTWLSGSTHSGIAIVSMDEQNKPAIVLGPGLGQRRGILCPDIFTSTSAPPASELAFAIGSTSGVLIIDKSTLSSRWLRTNFDSRESVLTDILALEYMEDNHSCRNGLLNILDLRIPREDDVIYHPSTITHIRQLDSHRILVAGLHSSMCQYDLRFRKSVTASHSKGQKIEFGSARTKSFLQYPEFQNPFDIRIAFDIDLETGIIATGREKDGTSPPVHLFSLHGGHKVTTPRITPDIVKGDNVGCLKFVRDECRGTKYLYVANNQDLHRFSWTDPWES